MTPGMEEEEEETGRQLPRGRLQWFLMLDYRYDWYNLKFECNYSSHVEWYVCDYVQIFQAIPCKKVHKTGEYIV